jgi:thiol-disulfide isomerase/thioredoxin
MKELQSEAELDEILKSPGKVVVFYFMNQCGHCQAMHKPYEELEKAHTDTKFVKVETKHIPDTLGKSAFPEFELRENKKVKSKAEGQMPKAELESKLFGGTLGGRRRRTRSRKLRRRTRKVLH